MIYRKLLSIRRQPAPADAGLSRESRRSPSPLRNSHTPTSEDGSEDNYGDDATWGRSFAHHSPSSSVTKFAATFAQRVGSFMSPARSPQMLPTDAELEAEAARERERSRKEAEKIIAMDRMKAEDRMTVEDRVMAVLQNEKLGSSSPIPIPQRSQSAVPPTPSPTASQKERAGWWAVTKSKLTPTKEPLTPAQQVVQETKAREKERQKEKRSASKGKDKERDKEWPTSSEHKYSDPAFLNLAMLPDGGPPRAISASPSSSPTPARYSNPSSLAPSPLRAAEAASSSKANRPVYAQFNSDGVLDVPSTLLMIAKRFEKLEKWTVGHVRALEDRMDDVERWLVDKETERERQSSMANGSGDSAGTTQEITDMKEELVELQGRVGEIGREMAKLATSPGNLISGPSRSSTSLGRAPSTVSSIAVRSMTASPPRSYPTSPQTKEPTSPIIAPLVPVLSGTRTRLPYPTGDYATPPDSVVISQGQFSPAGSPPSSVSSTTGLPRPLSFAGLPFTGSDISAYTVMGLPQSDSPNNNMELPTARISSATLPPPKANDQRPSSVSPTPRKRYTVALGGPIMSASRRLSSPPAGESSPQDAALEDEDNNDFQDETVGKAAGRRSDLNTFDKDSPRNRTQSTYGALSVAVAPLQPKSRSRSRSTVGLGISDVKGGNSKFVDPLVLRRREKEGSIPPSQKMLPNRGKKAVGDLVAFFDGGEK
jgi:hypothetical protein